MLPFAALVSATGTGPGPSLDLGTVAREFTLFVADDDTGLGGSYTVLLEGSPDNVHFVSLGSTGARGGGTPDLAALDAGPMHWVRYVRANLTAVSAGRTVSAWIC